MHSVVYQNIQYLSIVGMQCSLGAFSVSAQTICPTKQPIVLVLTHKGQVLKCNIAGPRGSDHESQVSRFPFLRNQFSTDAQASGQSILTESSQKLGLDEVKPDTQRIFVGM